MSTGSEMMIEKKFLTQIGGGVDPNANYPDPSLYTQSPVSVHGMIAPDGSYSVGVNVMVTPQVGLGTTFTSTPNGNMGGGSFIYKW